MALPERIPGMRPGCPGRNVSVGLVYLILLAVFLPVVARSYRPVRGC